jgi:hypothetical protein
VVNTVLTASLQSYFALVVDSGDRSIAKRNTAIAAPTVAPSNTGRHLHFHQNVATVLSIDCIILPNASVAKADRTEWLRASSGRKSSRLKLRCRREAIS